MRFAPDRDFSSYTIRAYQSGQVIVIPPVAYDGQNPQPVSEITLIHSFIIRPTQLVENWPPKSPEELTPEHFNKLLETPPELVIIGTGRSLEFPPASITKTLYSQGIGVEIMDTAAACRTYNVLMHEGRDVTAAVIID